MSIMNNLWAAMTAPWIRRFKSSSYVDSIDSSIGNAYDFTYRNAADTADVRVLELDSDDQLRLGDSVLNPLRQPVTIHLYPNANQVTQTIFTNPTNRSVYITGISEVHTTAGSSTGATNPRAFISHEIQSGGLLQAAGTGKSVMSGTFDLHATAETVQNATLVTTYQRATRNLPANSSSSPNAGIIVVRPGESLSIVYSGTLTALVGLTITLYMAPGGKFQFVSFQAAVAGTAVTTSLLTALRPRTLLFGAAVWGVKEATAATLTLDVTKDATATAVGAGTSMLASTVNLKLAANTYTQLALSATAANLGLISTDSVAVKVSAATTELAGLCVTLAFSGTQNEIEINYNAFNSTVGTSEEFWISDRDYVLLDFAGKIVTASTSNFVKVTIDVGTQAPSAGTAMQTTGFNTNTMVANTPTFPGTDFTAATNARFLPRGSRIGLLNSGTTGALAGLQVSLRLQAA